MINFLKPKTSPEKEVQTLSKIQIKEGEVWQIGLGRNNFLYCFREERKGKEGIVIDFIRYRENSRESKKFITSGREIQIDDDMLWKKFRTNYLTGDEIKIKYVGDGNVEIRYKGMPDLKMPSNVDTLVIEGGSEKEGLKKPDGGERHIHPVSPKYYELAKLPKIDALNDIVDEQREAIREGVFPRLLEGVDLESVDWEAGYTGDWKSWPPSFDIRKIKGPDQAEIAKVIKILTDFAGSENAIGMALTRYLSNIDRPEGSNPEEFNRSQIREFIRKEYGFLF